jgi:hypothetical protein
MCFLWLVLARVKFWPAGLFRLDEKQALSGNTNENFCGIAMERSFLLFFALCIVFVWVLVCIYIHGGRKM